MPKCCRRYGKSLAENKPLRWTRVYTLPDCVCFAKFSSPVVGGSAPQPTTGVPMFQPAPRRSRAQSEVVEIAQAQPLPPDRSAF